MNFSPLNDPGFEEFRKKEAAKAAKKRRKKALILLVTVTLVAALATVLIVLAAFDTVAKIRRDSENTEGTPTTAAPATEPSPATTDPTNLKPSTPLPVSETPTVPSSSPASETPTPSVKVRSTTVYLDAGHGFLNATGDSMDKGAGGPDYPYYKITQEQFGTPMYESDLVIILTQKVKAILEEAGYTVIMSREDYVYERVPIALRAAKAKEANADLLVSIHANSTGDASVYGARVYYNDNPAWPLTVESKKFAETVAASIDAYGASRRKARVYGDAESGKTLAMLRGTGDIPSVLVETCFLTNEEDAQAAITETWQNSMAKAIAQAIMDRYELKHTFV